MNEHTVIYVLTTFFILLGVVLPLIQADFGETVYDYDIQSIDDEIIDIQSSTNPLTVIGILWSVTKMFFWHGGGLIPSMIELIFLLPLRILFWFIIIKEILVNLVPFT